MKRCKHKNFNLYEINTCHTTFMFTDGEPPKDGIGWNSEIVPTGAIGFECMDCGTEKTYALCEKRPKYVQKAWDDLMKAQES